MTATLLPELLDRCMASRGALFDPPHESAFRLFNGFTEGFPDLVIDLYATTALITNYADPPERGGERMPAVQDFLRSRLPWLQAGILKTRNGDSTAEKRGGLIFGGPPARKIKENGVWYAVDLLMHQDAGLYLDTRCLRSWALEHLRGKTVLNAFAYTGSLGVAALAGGATRVVQLDRNQVFLNMARTSYALNGLPVHKRDFMRADFFQQAARFKRQGERFDCVFLDPPFFSASPQGVVDQVHEGARLINKVRPLVNHGGLLVTVNNAVYVSGKAYLQTLETLCADGYLSVAELVRVPDDFAGYPETRSGSLISDPTPFNHSTKIAVLNVRRKEQ